MLAPTRELALQVQTVLATLEKAAGLQSVAVYGGASIGNQARDLRRGVDIVVGTPGRINDFLERGDLELDQVEVLGMPTLTQLRCADRWARRDGTLNGGGVVMCTQLWTRRTRCSRPISASRSRACSG